MFVLPVVEEKSAELYTLSSTYLLGACFFLMRRQPVWSKGRVSDAAGLYPSVSLMYTHHE